MTSRRVRLAAAVVLVSALSWSGACSTSGEGGASSPPAGEGHAAANAQPGTWEDWCGEHGVPESQCTRCNRTLVPAFKAVNDWCAEHGLPESQCRACNPNLRIERPAKRGAR